MRGAPSWPGWEESSLHRPGSLPPCPLPPTSQQRQQVLPSCPGLAAHGAGWGWGGGSAGELSTHGEGAGRWEGDTCESLSPPLPSESYAPTLLH